MRIARQLKGRLQTLEAKLPSGEAGNLKTARIMRDIALERVKEPELIEFAHQIVTNWQVPSHDTYGEAIAIGETVKTSVRYVKDPVGIERILDPLTLISRIKRGVAQGDCDDMALLTATLLLAIGLRPRFKFVKYSSSDNFFSHIYVKVAVTNPRIKKPVDLCIDAILKNRPIGTEVPHEYAQELPLA